MTKRICKMCGYEWKAKKKNPVECPDCKSRYWDKKEVKE